MLFTILTTLTGLGGYFKSITDDLTNVQIAKVNATTEQEKADLSRQEQELHDKRAVLIAEAGSRINAIQRCLLAAGPTVVLLKLLVWDKSIGPFFGCVGHVPAGTCKMFTTDALDPNLWWVVTAVIGFYFLAGALKRGAK